jgi:hypothetical protein
MSTRGYPTADIVATPSVVNLDIEILFKSGITKMFYSVVHGDHVIGAVVRPDGKQIVVFTTGDKYEHIVNVNEVAYIRTKGAR